METSVEIKVLIIIAACAALSAYAVSWRITGKTRELVAWIEATFPEQWNAVPRYHRRWLKGAAIEGLRHRDLKNDSEFARRYDEIRHLKRWMIALIIAGSAAIGIVLLGTQFGGWSW
jgi:hypothetical protein